MEHLFKVLEWLLYRSGGDGIGGPFEEKPGVSSAESSLNGNNQQNKKRFSGGVSSQDGDYTTEGDSELSEQDGPADALQQTSSSTVSFLSCLEIPQLSNKTPAKHRDIFRLLKKVWRRRDSNPLATA